MPDKPPMSGPIRELMTSGQWFTYSEIQEFFQASRALPSLLKRELIKDGYRFKDEPSGDGGNRRWKCTNPKLGATRSYTPEEVAAQRAKALENVQAATERAQHAKAAAENGHTVALLSDPGPTMLGIPLESEIRSEAKTEGMIGTPMPFAGNVQVFAMILKEDGTLRFGIQSDDTRWFADVVGEVKR